MRQSLALVFVICAYVQDMRIMKNIRVLFLTRHSSAGEELLYSVGLLVAWGINLCRGLINQGKCIVW